MITDEPRLETGGLTLLNFHSLAPRQAAMVLRWRNSAGIRRWMYSDARISAAQHAAFMASLKKDGDNAYWLVKGPGRHWTGVIYLNRIDRAAGKAWLGIYANPESAVPGKGLALMDALEALAFGHLGLKRLLLEVFSTNLKALAFYRKRGFRPLRVKKAALERRGKAVDVTTMELRAARRGG